MSRLFKPPLAVTCPVCFSAPGLPCTVPTNNGRRPVQWYHLKREEIEDDPAVHAPG